MGASAQTIIYSKQYNLLNINDIILRNILVQCAAKITDLCMIVLHPTELWSVA